MNPDVKAKWLEALRSGEYEQGKLGLRNAEDRFCCLGVLCDIAVKDGVIGEPVPPATPLGFYSYAFETGGLPDAVSAWSGVDSHMGALPDGGWLSHINDEGATFEEIADRIEKEL